VKPEVILFDFFGTLVHYEADLSRLPYPQSHELLDGWGHDLSHDGFVRLWDMATMNLERKAVESHQEFSMMDTAPEFAASCPRALTDQQCHLLISTFLNEWKLHVMPVPGAADMLKRLAGSARLGVVSNTHDPTMVPEMLAAFDMAPMVDLVVLSVSHG
jgi:putative hydrolase of the HAD superfamily